MQNLIKSLLLISAVVCSSVANAAAETYTLDPNHSSVNWKINHFGFSNVTGKWYATGSMLYDENSPQNSKVTAKIDISKSITGIAKLDYNMLGTAFLDDVRYPTATFVSKTVIMTGANTAEVPGSLTLHGVTNPVLLKVIFNKVGIDPITNKKTAGFSATTIIERSDFGITTYVPSISDEVNIDIEVEATLTPSKGK